MKYNLLIIFSIIFFSCGTQKQANYSYEERDQSPANPPITESLFNDKSSTISEENIQKILNSDYKIPARVRIALIKLDDRKRNMFWNDEDYIKNEESNLSILTNILKKSSKVTTVSVVPELMISKPLSITNLREAGVRMQADLIIIFSSLTDTYSKYKIFSKADTKAFATTQAILLDTRTSLVPFTYVSTRDFLSQKTSDELNIYEARKRIQNEAVKLTLTDIANKMVEYLK